MADMEQSHSVCESLVRQRDETQQEAERLRASFRDLERTLGSRERTHRHRVKGLEEQVDTSKTCNFSVCREHKITFSCVTGSWFGSLIFFFMQAAWLQ